MKKTVFLTGATGNMGWAGFQELYARKEKFKIRILARRSRKNEKMLTPYLSDPAVEIVWGDLTRYDDVLAGVAGADYVLHVGGMVSPKADSYPEKTLKVNVSAARNIADAVLAQPDRDKVKVVYIGSVAQCGDRMPPFHWGCAGDPAYASAFDMYAVSKCEAERIIADSGIRHWVSLRQSGILYPGIFMQISPTLFHVPVKGVLEWATIEDSGRLLANVCEDWVPDEFWNRIYNISSGEQYRLTNYDFESRMLSPIGIKSIEKVFEPRWFATRNFHGMWYTDADILENYLHFRENLPLEDYFRRLTSKLPWYFSLARYVPASLIKAFLRPLAYRKGLGTQSWLKDDPEKLAAYYGSEEEYRSITGWEQLRPAHMEKNLDRALATGEAVVLDHGYDTSKPVHELSADELEKAAAFRGGRFLGPEESIGTKGAVFEWECEKGHRFKASLEYVLLGGGWCPECNADNAEKASTGRNRFISQILSSPCRE